MNSDNIEADELDICPGLYCGRTKLTNGSLSECGACPRGYQPSQNLSSLCISCEGVPSMYDFLYLGFMVLLSLGLHGFFIDFTNRKKIPRLSILYVSAIVETVCAAVITAIISDPFGEFWIKSCPVRRISDWYSMFYNPSPDYVNVIHCTQEIVYPLYTIVMIFYAVSLVCMLIVRPFLSIKLVNKKGTDSIYAALYFFPMLTVGQAILGGILYYSFPSILLIVSVITMAVHMSYCEDQEVKVLFYRHCTNARKLAILVCHWLLHAYAIVSITQMTQPLFHSLLLIFIPFPFLFYILTVKFTHPYKLEQC